MAHVVRLLIPSLFLMLVDLGSFHLPPSCRARIVSKASVLVGYAVFRVNAADEVPRRAVGTPLIGKRGPGSEGAFQRGGGTGPRGPASPPSFGPFPQGSSSRSAWLSWSSACPSPSSWSEPSMASSAAGRDRPSCAFEGTPMPMGGTPRPSPRGHQVCEQPGGPCPAPAPISGAPGQVVGRVKNLAHLLLSLRAGTEDCPRRAFQKA